MIEEVESAHIVYDGKKVVISPNLGEIFNFLINIDQELKSLLEVEKRLKSLTKKYQEVFGVLEFFAQKVKDAKVDFSYQLPKDTFDIQDESQSIYLYRSQMIALFAFMETLFCLVTVYDEELTDKKKIIERTKDASQDLIDQLILNMANICYKNNKERFSKIKAKSLKDLRHMLTHFFSVSSAIGIIPQEALSIGIEKEKLLHSRGHTNYVYISPTNLYELLQDALKLVMIKWNNDTINHPVEFKRKIAFVLDAVVGHGAKVVKIN